MSRHHSTRLWFSAVLLILLGAFPNASLYGDKARPRRDPQLFSEAELREAMPDAPWHFVPPIMDRAFWNRQTTRNTYFQTLIKRAYEQVKNLPPAPTMKDFAQYYEDRAAKKPSPFGPLTKSYSRALFKLYVGYCFTNDSNTFLAPISTMLRHYCQIHWSNPAWDTRRTALNGKGYPLDLYSTGTGARIASMAYVLKPVLQPDLYRQIQDAIDLQIVSSFERLLTKPFYGEGWFRGAGGNWTAVCLGELTVALAAADIESQRRIRLLTRCANHLKYYIDGFKGEGYTTEGFDYWAYGHGAFMLADTLFLQASHGKINLMERIPGATKATLFPFNILISQKIAPAYADCMIFSKCSPVMRMWCDYLTRYPQQTPTRLAHLNGYLIQVPPSGAQPPRTLPPVTHFPQAQVWILRPGETKQVPFGVSFKGGHNNEGHNHNDLGSYVIVQGQDGIIAVDPGAETYFWRTFSDQRFESKLLNSFGHSVPVIDGHLQPFSPNAKATVRRQQLTGKDTDSVLLDLRRAYDVHGIKHLTREFTYSRQGTGAFTVTDTFEFKHPMTFETAMIYLGKLEGLPGRNLTVSYRGESMRLNIDTKGGDCNLLTEEIKENVRSKVKVYRLAIRFNAPLQKGQVTLTFTPLTHALQPAPKK